MYSYNPVVYYYVTTDGWKVFWSLCIIFILTMVIMHRIIKKNYIDGGKQFPNLFHIFIGIVITFIIMGVISQVSTSLSPKKMSFFDKVGYHVGYIPDLSALCDKEGNRRFSSYDEYLQYYYNDVRHEPVPQFN